MKKLFTLWKYLKLEKSNTFLNRVQHNPIVQLFIKDDLMTESNYRIGMCIFFSLFLFLLDYGLAIIYVVGGNFLISCFHCNLYLGWLVYSLVIAHFTRIINYNKEDHVIINGFHFNALMYGRSKVLYTIGKELLYLGLVLPILTNFINLSCLVIIIILFTYPMSKIILEYFYERRITKKEIIENKIYQLLFNVISLEVFLYLLGLISNWLNSYLVVSIYTVYFVLFVYSFLELMYSISYFFLMRRYLKEEYIKIKEISIFSSEINLKEIFHPQYEKNNDFTEEKGISYLHTLFHSRFQKSIVTKQHIVCNLYLIFAILLIVTNFSRSSAFDLLSDSWFYICFVSSCVSIGVCLHPISDYLKLAHEKMDSLLYVDSSYNKALHTKDVWKIRIEYLKKLNQVNEKIYIFLVFLLSYALIKRSFFFSFFVAILYLLLNSLAVNLYIYLYIKLKIYQKKYKSFGDIKDLGIMIIGYILSLPVLWIKQDWLLCLIYLSLFILYKKVGVIYDKRNL